MIKNKHLIKDCIDKVKIFIDDYLEKEFGNYGDIIITDGFRTMAQHEEIYKKIYGTNYKNVMPKYSAHLLGKAVDFYVKASIHPIKIAKYLLDINVKAGITGIGMPLGNKWAFHVDFRDHKNGVHVWYYKNNGQKIDA